MNVHLEYDPEADGAYLWFVDIDKAASHVTREVWPAELNDQIGLLFDHEGKLIGMEVQPASLYFDADWLQAKKGDE